MKTENQTIAKIDEYIEKKDACYDTIRSTPRGSPEYERAERDLDRNLCIIQALQWARGREPL